jgi:hypothetical protein
MSKRVNIVWALVLLFLAAFLHHPGKAFAASGEVKLGPVSGEEFIFNVHWMGIPSGTAIMRFNRTGKSGYRLESSLKSYGGVDFFFPIRDNFVVTGQDRPDQLLAEVYTKQQDENGKKRTVEFRFDRPNKKMLFQRDNEKKEVVLDGEINDYLSAVFSVRKKPLKPGDHFSTNIVLEKEKIYNTEIMVGEREGISTANGYIYALPVSLVIKNSKRYKKQGDFAFWFTDDDRHMPIRIKIRANVGSIGMDLMEYKDGRGGSGNGEVESED